MLYYSIYWSYAIDTIQSIDTNILIIRIHQWKPFLPWLLPHHFQWFWGLEGVFCFWKTEIISFASRTFLPWWQGFFSLKNKVFSSSRASHLVFTAYRLNELATILLFTSFHTGTTHWTTVLLGTGFMFPPSVNSCLLVANHSSYFSVILL